jgi:hypothetical protein
MTSIFNLGAKLVADVNGYISDMKAAGQSTTDTKTSIMGLAGQALAAVGGIAAISAELKKVITDTLAYSDSVRDLSRLSGMSTEESSKMLTMFHDLNMNLPNLDMALKTMAKNGLTMSVDEMAKLSDEYLALAPGAERDKFLTDEFGKSGLELAKVMEIGGQAIKDRAAATSGGLVLTQAQVDADRKLEVETNQLTDTTKGLEVEFGNFLIPILNSAANALDAIINKLPTINTLLAQHASEVGITSTSYQGYVDELTRAAKGVGDHINENGDLVSALGKVIQSNYVLTEGTWEAVRAGEAAVSTDKMLAMGLNDVAAKAKAAAAAQITAAAATDAGADASKKYSASLLYQMAAGSLDSAQQLQLARGLGLVDENTVKASQGVAEIISLWQSGKITWQEALALITEVGKALALIQSKDITITAHYVGFGGVGSVETPPKGYAAQMPSFPNPTDSRQYGMGPTPTGNPYATRASGGDISGLAMVGENGAELVNFPPGSRVHSNTETRELLSGGMSDKQYRGLVQMMLSNRIDYDRMTRSFINAMARNIIR